MTNIVKKSLDFMLASNCRHRGTNSWARAQHSHVQSQHRQSRNKLVKSKNSFFLFAVFLFLQLSKIIRMKTLFGLHTSQFGCHKKLPNLPFINFLIAPYTLTATSNSSFSLRMALVKMQSESRLKPGLMLVN